jgi:hypothetical protein
MVLANCESPANEARVQHDICADDSKEAKHFSVEIAGKCESTDATSEEIYKPEELHVKERVSLIIRLSIFIFCIFALIIGRLGIPDEESSYIIDRVVNALQGANDFINKSGNEFYRDLMQMICSFFVDVVFLTTFGYWVLRGKGIRLPVTLCVFYIIRALVQMVWVSPFPEGYYWEAPILPSLVVPYGRGSDFFFSGHSGFLVICASEWHKIKMPKMRNFAICVAIYTIFILLTYRIHYSIDIFTGVVFAEWCFGKVDLLHDKILNFFIKGASYLKRCFGIKSDNMIDVDEVLAYETSKSSSYQV